MFASRMDPLQRMEMRKSHGSVSSSMYTADVYRYGCSYFNGPPYVDSAVMQASNPNR